MRNLLKALFLVAAVFSFAGRPGAAHAAGIIEGSLGKGAQVKPETQAQPINVMVAPGFAFPLVRLQLGLVADLPDVKESKFDIGLRPMLTISPPILPLYARLILAANNLTHSELRSLAYGGAVGLSVSLVGIGIFAEAGLLPRNKDDQFLWVVEGRAGVSFEF